MDLIKETIAGIRPIDRKAMKEAGVRQDSLTKPQGALGDLELLSIQVAGIRRDPRPRIARKVIFTMAADHGIAQEGVSAYPSEVTGQMVMNFLNGGAGINVLGRLVGADIVVADLGIASPSKSHPRLKQKKISAGTRSMVQGPAMTREEAIRSIEAGIELTEEELRRGIDLLGTGDMGIGNTTPSSAITALMTGTDAALVTGRGAGLDDGGLKRKEEMIRKAILLNRPDPKDPIDALSKIGGFEIGGIAGIILAGAKNRIPVVLDGFVSGAAALIANGLSPLVKPYLIASHQSAEKGHGRILEYLGLKPLLNLGLRLGEGTGAALGIFLVEASLRLLNEMATFAEAGVSGKAS